MRQKIGNILIFIGAGMWLPYAVGKYMLGWNITDRQFLPYHLAVIIPGMMLRHYSGIACWLVRQIGRKGAAGHDDR